MSTSRPRRARPPADLRISVTDADGRPVRSGAAAGLSSWLRRAAPRRARGRVAVAIVSDRQMRRMNRAFRGHDRPTDVLSFPAGGKERGGSGAGGRFLGDLAIAAGVAARQARSLGHSTAAELRILALHGLLHLLGYDHEADQGEMARAEERLRRRAGLPTGLIVRTGARRRTGR